MFTKYTGIYGSQASNRCIYRVVRKADTTLGLYIVATTPVNFNRF